MNTLWLSTIGLILAATTALAPPVAAQECTIRHLGGANRFVDTVDSTSELQSVFTSKWSEIERMLGESGWTGDPKDLAAVVAKGNVTEKSYPKGTRFEWMLLRKGGKPSLLRDQCWGGTKPFEGYAFDVESKGRRSHFVVPKACGNLALVGSEASPASPPPKAAQAPVTAPPAPPAPPPPAPEPPPPPAPAPPPPPQTAAPPPVPPPPAEHPHTTFELFGGYFVPDDLDDDWVYGVRFGRRGVGNWGWQVGGSWYQNESAFSDSGNIDADLVNVDFSAAYYPGDGNFSIFFGPGFLNADIDNRFTGAEHSDDTFSLHLGVGYEADINPHFYVKPDVRVRWYELSGLRDPGSNDDEFTYEGTIALGWRFGK
jgi:hypothetical protein